eukprot:TRINITY_DN5040_c0_g1_i3.p1 TRINITY_DN5040_c0_g1~~TRINITY_DN5040_c0_g1_i3.p1  ORF type:complete len:492 (-),score=133.75 TRINITY_DN5040_c0_g1_i3:169-1644(-)
MDEKKKNQLQGNDYFNQSSTSSSMNQTFHQSFDQLRYSNPQRDKEMQLGMEPSHLNPSYLSSNPYQQYSRQSLDHAASPSLIHPSNILHHMSQMGSSNSNQNGYRPSHSQYGPVPISSEADRYSHGRLPSINNLIHSDADEQNKRRKLEPPTNNNLTSNTMIDQPRASHFPKAMTPTSLISRKKSNEHQSTSKYINITPNDPKNRFTLKKQPNPMQRKSYQKENRYLMPNPFVVFAREKPSYNHQDNSSESKADYESKWSKITHGSIAVRLTDNNGDNLPEHKSGILETAFGTFQQDFVGKALCEFSLKVLENSNNDGFALVFTISYSTEDGKEHNEVIQTSPFKVQSNKSLKMKGEPPRISHCNPKQGKYLEETEVWIRGSQFRKQGMSVFFGDKEGRVVEVLDNFIIVYAPPRPQIDKDTMVDIHIMNHFAKKIIPSDDTLPFTYLFDQTKRDSPIYIKSESIPVPNQQSEGDSDDADDQTPAPNTQNK